VAAGLDIVVPLGPGELAWRTLLPSVLASTSADVWVVATPDAREEDLPTPEPRLRRVLSRQGRAAQMNAGAAAGTAAWLWFLHADSRLATDSFARLADYLDAEHAGIGYFDLRFLADGPGLVRLNEWGARLRSRWLGLPFGDQGFVMRRETFGALGGFDESLPGGEDHALVWRARRAGLALRPIGADLWTSARKYRHQGWLGTTFSHLGATLSQARRFARSEVTR
jgi:hypothetical protein